MDYAKSFLIGASPLVTLPFYGAVSQIPERNFTLGYYCPAVPLYFGSLNVVSSLVGNYFGWSLQKRLFIISIMSALFIMIWITIP